MAKLITIEKSTFDKAIDAINRENKDLREQLKASREKSHEFYDLLQTMRGKLVACEKENATLKSELNYHLKKVLSGELVSKNK